MDCRKQQDIIDISARCDNGNLHISRITGAFDVPLSPGEKVLRRAEPSHLKIIGNTREMRGEKKVAKNE